MSYYIGLMSGTSMDGIDAAVVDVHYNRLVSALTVPYSAELRDSLEDILSHEQIDMPTFSYVHTFVGREFASAAQAVLKKAHLKPKDIVAIGSHGQTIAHDSFAKTPYSIQLGCAHTIAENTHIQVVSDFRTRDLIVGGCGAPFAPLYHQVMAAHLMEPVAIINIGGIANVSLLAPGEKAVGYDIGPGNCLMDAWIKTNLGYAYDQEGKWAATGQVIPKLLESLLADPFFQKSPPKSIGKEYFSLSWLGKYLEPNLRPENIQATLLALTLQLICNTVSASTYHCSKVLLCGGGASHVLLLEKLRQRLPHIHVDTTQVLGLNPDYIEAMMFAWLAEKAVQQIPVDLTMITGAQKKAVLGVIYPGS